MIELIEVYGGVHDARAIARDLEAKGRTVLSVTAGVQGGYLITVREPVSSYNPLGSRLQKGLRLAVFRLLAWREGSTSPEIVSLLALAEGRESVHDMDVIESALSRLGR